MRPTKINTRSFDLPIIHVDFRRISKGDSSIRRLSDRELVECISQTGDAAGRAKTSLLGFSEEFFSGIHRKYNRELKRRQHEKE